MKNGLASWCKECTKRDNRGRWDRNKDLYNENHREWTRNNKEYKALLDRQYRERLETGDKARAMHYSTKSRAKKTGVQYDLTPEDIVIPDKCPLLGISLKRGVGKLCPASPTLDRIDSSKGYVKGNVWVISHRANCIKNDSTPDELIHIGETLREMFPHLTNATTQIQNKPR